MKIERIIVGTWLMTKPRAYALDFTLALGLWVLATRLAFIAD